MAAKTALKPLLAPPRHKANILHTENGRRSDKSEGEECPVVNVIPKRRKNVWRAKKASVFCSFFHSCCIVQRCKLRVISPWEMLGKELSRVGCVGGVKGARKGCVSKRTQGRNSITGRAQGENLSKTSRQSESKQGSEKKTKSKREREME